MLKREVEIGGEYAWQERYSFNSNEYRKVTLLKFLSNPGGRHVLVRDKDGEFETHLERLVKPWSELGAKGKESKFRTRAEKYEPRVPEWLPRRFEDMASAVLKLDMGLGVVEDEQIACYQMLREMVNACERIRNVAREMLPAWEVEDKAAQYSSWMAEKVRGRLDDGDLPFASSEIMPVHANYGMSRSRATTQHHTGSIVAADFMERVADDYEELDRYASLAVRWARGFYLRWRTEHQAEMQRALPSKRRRSRSRR